MATGVRPPPRRQRIDSRERRERADERERRQPEHRQLRQAEHEGDHRAERRAGAGGDHVRRRHRVLKEALHLNACHRERRTDQIAATMTRGARIARTMSTSGSGAPLRATSVSGDRSARTTRASGTGVAPMARAKTIAASTPMANPARSSVNGTRRSRALIGPRLSASREPASDSTALTMWCEAASSVRSSRITRRPDRAAAARGDAGIGEHRTLHVGRIAGRAPVTTTSGSHARSCSTLSRGKPENPCSAATLMPPAYRTMSSNVVFFPAL